MVSNYRFNTFVNYPLTEPCSKKTGLRRLKVWRRKVLARGMTCFNIFLELLDTWLDGIANSFRNHQTSGFVEVLNNKPKILKRRCFGMTNHCYLFQRITLDIKGYRRFVPQAFSAPQIENRLRDILESRSGFLVVSLNCFMARQVGISMPLADIRVSVQAFCLIR